MNGERDQAPQQGMPQGYSETVRSRGELDPQTRQWQLSGTDIIEEIRHRLRGEIPNDNPNDNEVWKSVSDPLADETGVGELCWLLSTYINKNVQLSWFSDQQIRDLLMDFESSLSRKMESDRRRMGIRKEDMDSVFLMLSNTIWAAINRARFGGEKQFIEGTEQRRIVSSESGREEKGWMDKIPFLGGK